MDDGQETTAMYGTVRASCNDLAALPRAREAARAPGDHGNGPLWPGRAPRSLRIARRAREAALWLGACLALGACASKDAGGEQPAASQGNDIVLSDGVHGPQKVRAGKSLSPKNPGGATVRSGSTGAAIIVETEPGKRTTVRDIAVQCVGGTGILVRGGGSFQGDKLRLECTQGIGIAAEGQSKVILSDITLDGGVKKDRIPSLAFPLSWDQAPIIGLALSKVASATLQNVSIKGFAGFGIVFASSTVVMYPATLSENIGAGIMQDGGMLSLGPTVTVTDTWAGQTGTAVAAYGIVVANRGVLETQMLHVERTEGPGILQDNAVSRHSSGISFKDNADVGIWVQHSPGTLASPALKLGSAGGMIQGNKGGGVFVTDSGGIDIGSTSPAPLLVYDSVEKPVATTEAGMEPMADGIQISAATGEISLHDLYMVNHKRVSVLLDGPMTLTASGINVGTPTGYGSLAQNGATRPPIGAVKYTDPQAQTTDEAFTGRLGVAAVRTGVVSVSGITQNGLLGATGLVTADGEATSRAVVRKEGLVP
jgi:hypothetical protein